MHVKIFFNTPTVLGKKNGNFTNGKYAFLVKITKYFKFSIGKIYRNLYNLPILKF